MKNYQEELAKKLAPRRVVYKKVMTLIPHCPVCGEKLKGNDSLSDPWHCQCGEWDTAALYEDNAPGLYKIKMRHL